MFRLGLAVSLFQKSYSELMEAVLYALMSRFFLRTFEKRIVYAQNHCKQVFAKTANATSYVATYLTCLISFALSSLDEIPTTTTILFNIIIVIIKRWWTVDVMSIDTIYRSSWSLVLVLFKLYFILEINKNISKQDYDCDYCSFFLEIQILPSYNKWEFFFFLNVIKIFLF